MATNSIELKADTTELTCLMDGLLPEIGNAPSEVRKLFLDFFDFPAKLFCFENSATSGAVVSVFLKPSQLFVDLSAAIRASNFDFVRVEHSHNFSFVDGGLVELPILST